MRCLGYPVLERDGTEVKFSRRKSLALLAYLAVTGQTHARESLAALLWPAEGTSPALRYLRTILSDIGRACPDRLLETDRSDVRLAPGMDFRLDVRRFRELADRSPAPGAARPADRARLSEALQLYRGSFLRGFGLEDAPQFEDWQREASDELQRCCEAVLESLIRACVTDGDYDGALGHARRLLGMDELDERRHRLLMSLEALLGRHAAVEVAYKRCCRVLREELGAEPEVQTRRLCDQVKSARGAVLEAGLREELRGRLLGGSRAGGAVHSGRSNDLLREPMSPSTRLRGPEAVFVDSRFRIYIADSGNCRIVRIDDMDGTGVTALGTEGSGPGQFDLPRALCVDTRGRIYAADAGAKRIVRFDDMSGSGWVSFGAYGDGRSCFREPDGVCVDSGGRILVSDRRNNRVVRFDDMSGAGWVFLGGSEPGEGPGRFSQPSGIFVDISGRIYVATRGATVVRMDGMDGSGWVTVRPANLALRVRTMGLAVDPDQGAIHVVVYGLDRPMVVRVAGMTGLRWSYLDGRPGHTWSPASRRNVFVYPNGICLDARHRIYIADCSNDRIVRVDDIRGNGWCQFPPLASEEDQA